MESQSPDESSAARSAADLSGDCTKSTRLSRTLVQVYRRRFAILVKFPLRMGLSRSRHLKKKETVKPSAGSRRKFHQIVDKRLAISLIDMKKTEVNIEAHSCSGQFAFRSRMAST